jgi:hypothetical protein
MAYQPNYAAKKMTIKLTIAAVMTLVFSGCETLADTYDEPAHIINADDASRAALREAVNSALNTEVTLADSALTDSSLLTIERNPPRTMENPNPLGRNMEMPIQLRLFINGTDCVLVDQRDRARYVLASTSCEAE